jgi:hypothetical protein
VRVRIADRPRPLVADLIAVHLLRMIGAPRDTDGLRLRTVADLTVGLHLRRVVAHTDALCLCRPTAGEAMVAAGLPLPLTEEADRRPTEAEVVVAPCLCHHLAAALVAEVEHHPTEAVVVAAQVDSAAVGMLLLAEAEVTVVVAEAVVTITVAEGDTGITSL